MAIDLRLETLETIKDLREALKLLQDSFNGIPLNNGNWKFFEIVVKSAVNHLKYPHNLNFLPKDVILISVSDDATVTWNYASFDRTNLDITTNKACTIRAYVGLHLEGTDA